MSYVKATSHLYALRGNSKPSTQHLRLNTFASTPLTERRDKSGLRRPRTKKTQQNNLIKHKVKKNAKENNLHKIVGLYVTSKKETEINLIIQKLFKFV